MTVKDYCKVYPLNYDEEWMNKEEVHIDDNDFIFSKIPPEILNKTVIYAYEDSGDDLCIFTEDYPDRKRYWEEGSEWDTNERGQHYHKWHKVKPCYE